MYATVQSPVKFYVTIINILFRGRCFNAQNTALFNCLGLMTTTHLGNVIF